MDNSELLKSISELLKPMENKLGKIENRLDKIESRLDKIEEEVVDMKTDLKLVKIATVEHAKDLENLKVVK